MQTLNIIQYSSKKFVVQDFKKKVVTNRIADGSLISLHSDRNI